MKTLVYHRKFSWKVKTIWNKHIQKKKKLFMQIGIKITINATKSNNSIYLRIPWMRNKKNIFRIQDDYEQEIYYVKCKIWYK